jgi:hypothetical protein
MAFRPPRRYARVLDDYVIGQNHAKKVLSVEVHNHYKRLNHQTKHNDVAREIEHPADRSDRLRQDAAGAAAWDPNPRMSLELRSPVPVYEAPDYQRTTFHDRIAPGGIKETRVIASIAIPLIGRPMLVYGRYWFEDIWKDKHTSGFVLVIEETGTNPHVPAGVPRAYTDWN